MFLLSFFVHCGHYLDQYYGVFVLLFHSVLFLSGMSSINVKVMKRLSQNQNNNVTSVVQITEN